MDEFNYTIISQNLDFADMFSVVQLISTLSHGHATAKLGFSINADMLEETYMRNRW